MRPAGRGLKTPELTGWLHSPNSTGQLGEILTEADSFSFQYQPPFLLSFLYRLSWLILLFFDSDGIRAFEA